MSDYLLQDNKTTFEGLDAQKIANTVQNTILDVSKLRNIAYIVYRSQQGRYISAEKYLKKMQQKWRADAARSPTLVECLCVEAVLDILEPEFVRVCTKNAWISSSMTALDYTTAITQKAAFSACKHIGFNSFLQFENWYFEYCKIKGENDMTWKQESILRYHLRHFYLVFYDDIPTVWFFDPQVIINWCVSLYLERYSSIRVWHRKTVAEYSEIYRSHIQPRRRNRNTETTTV